jgi:hypothetical protein
LNENTEFVQIKNVPIDFAKLASILVRRSPLAPFVGSAIFLRSTGIEINYGAAIVDSCGKNVFGTSSGESISSAEESSQR